MFASQFDASGKTVRTEVCQKFWQRIYGISNNRVQTVMDMVKNGCTSTDSARDGSKFTSDNRALTAAYLDSYFEDNCDKQPGVNGQKAEWHLPSTTTKEELYAEYRQWCADAQQESVSLSYFRKIWKQEFPHVTIPERSRFKECQTCVLCAFSFCVCNLNACKLIPLRVACTNGVQWRQVPPCCRCAELKERIKKGIPEERAEARALRTKHRRLVDRERREIQTRTFKALHEPHK